MVENQLCQFDPKQHTQYTHVQTTRKRDKESCTQHHCFSCVAHSSFINTVLRCNNTRDTMSVEARVSVPFSRMSCRRRLRITFHSSYMSTCFLSLDSVRLCSTCSALPLLSSAAFCCQHAPRPLASPRQPLERLQLHSHLNLFSVR
jgi:hypothetical protein